MKHNFKKTIPFTICLCILAIILSYNTPYYICKYAWKNNDGARISDVIIFKGNDAYTINWPFVYKKDKKIGCIVFCLYKNIWIYSYNGKEDSHIGIYYRFISCEK